MKPTLKTSLVTVLALGMVLPSAVHARGWIKGQLNDPNNFINVDWHRRHYTYKLFEMDKEGSVENQNLPWGDSYWPSQRAGMAYRWRLFQDPNMDQGISGDDHVEERRKLFFDIKRYPRSELLAMKRNNPAEFKRVIGSLAPLEKFALFVSKPGEENYFNSPILNEFTKSKQAEREYWEGYCHAWSAVSSHYGEPLPVTKTTADGLEIPFYSGDVKALLIANYQQKTSSTFGGAVSRFFDKSKKAQVKFVGKRCGTVFMYPVRKLKQGKEVWADYGETENLTEQQYLTEYLPAYQKTANKLKFSYMDDGIESQPDFIEQVKAKMDGCENTNAGAFHIVIANQLGKFKEGFQFDKTRDAEVWNQPAYKYTSQLERLKDSSGRPVTSLPTSAPNTVSVVKVKTKLYYADDSDYGWTYSTPANLGLFNFDGSTFQSMIQSFKEEYAKYSRILMNEGDEHEELVYPKGIHDAAEYEYTLDINAAGEIIGGDWISFNRPDYMWIMKKEGFFDDYKRLEEIYQPVQYPAGQTPNFGSL